MAAEEAAGVGQLERTAEEIALPLLAARPPQKELTRKEAADVPSPLAQMKPGQEDMSRPRASQTEEASARP
jgi:hypothetical protein